MFRFFFLTILLMSVIGCSEQSSSVSSDPVCGTANIHLGNFDEASVSVLHADGIKEHLMVCVRVNGLALAAGDSLYLFTPLENNIVEVRKVITTGNQQPQVQELQTLVPFVRENENDNYMQIRGDGQLIKIWVDFSKLTPGTIDVLS